MSDNNDSSQQRSFQVLDRRRFDSEGRERPDDSRTEVSSHAAVAGASAPRTAGHEVTQQPVQGQYGAAGIAGGSASHAEPQGTGVRSGRAGDLEPDFRMAPSEPEEADGVSFLSFIMSMATQAMVQIGEMEPPEGMGIPVDLEAGRQSIDLLSMLQRKTRGNLTSEEARLFEEVLHGLRVSYLRRAR